MSSNSNNEKGARSVPQLRIPGAGPRKMPEAPAVITGPAITPKEQWPLPPGSANASPPRPLVLPPRPPRPASKDTPLGSSRTDVNKASPPRPDPNRLTVPDSSAFKFPTPNDSRPVTGVSMASTSSRYSTGEDDGQAPSVPIFPQQLADDLQQDERYSQQLLQQRNRPPLGPPPSARRGPASYYSQHVAVDIIEEESNSDKANSRPQSNSRSSFASSNVMGSDIPDYYRSSVAGTIQARRISDDARSSHLMVGAAHIIQPPPPAAAAEPVPRSVPGRQALQQASPPRKPVGRPPPPVTRDSTGPKGGGPPARHHSSMYPRSSFGSSKTMSVKFDTGADNPMPDIGKTHPAPVPATAHGPGSGASPPAYDISRGDGDPRVISILGRLTKGGALGYDDEDEDDIVSVSESSELGDSPSEKRPERRERHSQVDRPTMTTRDGNGRASITSLPGMIRRATTLASNLDRGRTASRVGTHWFGHEKRPGQTWQRQSTYLDAFPPSAFPHDQALGARGEAEVPRKSTIWPWRLPRGQQTISYFREGRGRVRNSMMRKFDADDGERRIWGFTVPMLFFMGIVATLLLLAVVLLPIVLVVIPHEHDSGRGGGSGGSGSGGVKAPVSLDTCRTELACRNGGVSFVGEHGTACQCLCVNGWTGLRCTQERKDDCVGHDTETAKNASVGDALPRIFTGAATNYSITLDPQIILGLFSLTNLTCASENALVTFNGLMKRSASEARGRMGKRQDNIVFAPGSSTSPGSGDGSAAPGPGTRIDTRALDVARIAVMVILQDTQQLNDGIVAQQSLQNFFISGGQSASDPSAVQIGNGYTVNLQDGQVVNPNGTVFGQRMTRRAE